MKSTGVSVEATFDHPIEHAWTLLADFAGLPNTVTGVGEVKVTGSGVGAVRRVPFEDHFTDERLEVMDPLAHRVVYAVITKSPNVNREDYVAEMRLEPDGPARCRFLWSSRFTLPDDADEAEEKRVLERAYRISIAGFQKHLAASARG